MSGLMITPDMKQAIKSVEIDDDAHWLLGDYGREARTWGHVDTLFETNMLSMEGNALRKLNTKAATTYYLKVYSETIAEAQGLSDIAEIMTLVDASHKKLMSALQQLEKDTVGHPETRNTEEVNTTVTHHEGKTNAASRATPRASHAPARAGASNASLRASQAPAGASYASLRTSQAPAGASYASLRASQAPARAARAPHPPTRATYNPTRASGVQASAARQAAIRDAMGGHYGESSRH